MKYKTHEAEKINAFFECEDCNNTIVCNVGEAIFNGPPLCEDCNEEMSLDHIIIEDKET